MISRQHRTRPAVRRSTLALIFGAMLMACGDSTSAPDVPSGPAGIAGRITSVVPEGTYRGAIRVEANPLSSSGSPKADVTVLNGTIVLLTTRKEGDFRSLAVGQWVRVWFEGAVMESYPVQGTAGTVVIDSTGIGINQNIVR